MTEFEKLGLDSYLEKIEDEEVRGYVRTAITALEPHFGRPTNVYKNGFFRVEIPVHGRTLVLRVSVGV